MNDLAKAKRGLINYELPVPYEWAYMINRYEDERYVKLRDCMRYAGHSYFMGFLAGFLSSIVAGLSVWVIL